MHPVTKLPSIPRAPASVGADEIPQRLDKAGGVIVQGLLTSDQVNLGLMAPG